MKKRLINFCTKLGSVLIDMFRVKSLQFIITVSFALVTVLAMFFISFLLYNKFADTAEQNAALNNQQIIEQVNYNLDYYLNGMTQIFDLVDEKIRKSNEMTDANLIEQLGTIFQARQDIVSMAVFTGNGELVTSIPKYTMRKNTRLTEQSWFRTALATPDLLFFSSPHTQNLFKGQYKWVVSMSKGITVRSNNEKMTSVLLVDANFKTIEDLVQRVSLGKKGYVYILDREGHFVYHPQQQLLSAGLKEENLEQTGRYAYGSYVDYVKGEKRLITIKTVEKIGWKIVGVSYMDEIVTTKKEIIRFIFWLLIFVILVVLFILAYISAKISRPIKILEKSMERVEQGDFSINLDIKGSQEVEQLSRRFNVMVVKVRQLMDQIIREQEAKRKGELEVLQAQINPHFLYNTLNSVIRMVGIGKNEDVITTISSLSKLFRISLSRGKAVITVQEELEHIRHYLIIQKMRYKNKFEYEIEASDEVLTCKTLKLILQPIVENSIYHGIEMMADEGLITISASVVDGKILFQVSDNGLGMSQDRIAAILSGQVKSDKGSGVGVKNVHERIRLYYGEEYGVHIKSQLEVGTTVKIWVPFIKEEEE